jgi:hypothetical protein
MRLFHLSEQSDIGVFEPRPVKVPSRRPTGLAWLNGPLVWAIDGWHQPLYFFPRDCPRILLWPAATTTAEDRDAHWTAAPCRMIAYVEAAWLERIRGAVLYRYELPVAEFESLDDAGMWVSRTGVTPLGVERIDDVLAALCNCDVELRVVPNLAALSGLWSTSLHVSGIRLRNAQGGWPAAPL